MKAPNSRILSITAIIAAILAIACSVVNARNCARLVTTSPPRSSLYYHQVNYDPLGLVSEMMSTPMSFRTAATKPQQRRVEVSAPPDRSIPRYSVSEENGLVQLELEIPGVYAKDVEIDLEDDTLLRIKGRRTFKRHSDGSVDQSEFDVTFRLKENVDTNQLKANLVAGILRVQVPNKVKDVKRIPIRYDDIGGGHDDSVVGIAPPKDDGESNQTDVSSSSLLDAITTFEIVDGIAISGDTDA